ncbi:phosphoribosylamine--glycine ligase [Lentibacillus sediminis]|uniref:phosphoribosylamine--glycine ligase n=1 Tax=Lentibacillus sediminis TaxID=1940529 RepID=UPI000C1C5146|nr:phosphoribosylamine--glycine ligase [Lentibacillus sediminis]
MNILVIGRGGREHSIISKLVMSNRVSKLYAAPGNGGIQQQAECVAIDEMDMDGLVAFAKEQAIDLTIVGPENPLNAGIADRFREEGLRIFAPNERAALLEGSKQFAKEFMKKYEIPTAGYAVFSDADEAKLYITDKGAPLVVKADGLAAGKGVIVALTQQEALEAVDDMLVSGKFAEAGATVVIEEFLEGREFSLMAFVHEDHVYPMVTSRDHKRAYDWDKGPNTGGMGAYAPAGDISREQLAFCEENILQKTADGLMKEGRPFTGILYAGLMMTEDGPKVIEFNTRFGDPETQVVLPLLKNDLLEVIEAVMAGENPRLEWEDSACLGVVLAANGYPDSYEKGLPVPEFSSGQGTFIVHAGTKMKGDSLVSDGGRVMLVGAKAEQLSVASGRVYGVMHSAPSMERYFYRNDIGI